MNALTLKQSQRLAFNQACDNYRACFNGPGCMAASIALHAARYDRASASYARRLFKELYTPCQTLTPSPNA